MRKTSASDPSYSAGHVTLTINVALRPPTITFSTVPPAYLGETTSLGASSDSGLAVSYTTDPSPSDVCSLNTDTANTAVVKFLRTGTCIVNLDQSGSFTVAAAPQRSVSFAVVPSPVVVAPPAPIPQVITVPPATQVIVGATYTIPATTDSVVSLTYAVDASSTSGVCTLSGSTVTFSSVGTCVVNITQPGDTTHEAALAV